MRSSSRRRCRCSRRRQRARRKYTKLSAVFASHEHLFYAKGPLQRTSASTTPTRIVTGGAGAPLKGSSSYNHYLTVTVSGANVTVTVVRLPSMPSNCPS